MKQRPNAGGVQETVYILKEHGEAASRYVRFRLWLVRQRGIVAVIVFLILWVFAYLLPSIAITIPAGHVGVLWRYFGGGTVTEKTYGEGLNAIWPWNEMYSYDRRYQQITHGVDVLSQDGLQYHIDVTVRFRIRPDKAALLHRNVGPDYVEKLILPVVASRVRGEVARHTSEEVYTNRYTLELTIGENIKLLPLTMPEPYDYLEMSDVFVRNIVLPPLIAEAIQSKLVHQQQVLEYNYRLEKEEKEKLRKVIEAEGIRQFQDIFNTGVSDSYLKWYGIGATLELAKSDNSKIVIFGHQDGGLPIIFGDGMPQSSKKDANGLAPSSKDGAQPSASGEEGPPRLLRSSPR